MPFQDLPTEILELIFNYSDHNSHWAIMCTCKLWNSVLKNVQHLTFSDNSTTINLDNFLYKYPMIEKVTLNIPNATSIEFSGHFRLKCIESNNDLICQFFQSCPMLKRVKIELDKQEPTINVLQCLLDQPIIEIAEFSKVKVDIVTHPLPTKLKRLHFKSGAWEMPIVFSFIDSGCCPELKHFFMQGDLYLPQRGLLALSEQTKLEHLELKHIALAPQHTLQLVHLKLKTLKMTFCEISLPDQSKYSRLGQLVYIILLNNHIIETIELSHCNLIVNPTESIAVATPIDVNLKNISVFDVANHLYTREIKKLSSFNLDSFKVSLKSSQWTEDWISNIKDVKQLELRFTHDESSDAVKGVTLNANKVAIWAPPPNESFLKTIANSAPYIQDLTIEYPSPEFVSMMKLIQPIFTQLKKLQINSYGNDVTLPLYDCITTSASALTSLNLQMLSQKTFKIDLEWIFSLKNHSPFIRFLYLQGFEITIKDLRSLLLEFVDSEEISITGPGLLEFDTADEVLLKSSLLEMTHLKKFGIGMKQVRGKSSSENSIALKTVEQFVSSQSAQEQYREKLQQEINTLVWWSETKIWQNLRHF